LSGTDAAREIALFPLHTVLFPGGLLPLRVFEPRYMEMTTACLRGSLPFGVCLISEGREVGAPAVPHAVGCLARIMQWDMQQLGVLNITVRGEKRFRVLERRVQRDGLIRSEIELLAEEDDALVPEALAVCARVLKAIIDDGAAPGIEAPFRFESASWVSARLTEILPLPLAFKQQLLETDGSCRRLEALREALRDQKLVSEK
jgi:Lon protease-like protein